jgi:hypothetical protein
METRGCGERRPLGWALAIGLMIFVVSARDGRADEAPLTILDMAGEPDTAVGGPMAAWMRKRADRWQVKFGAPAYFFIQGGSLHLVAKQGPMSSSILIWRLLKREDKVIVQLTPPGFRHHLQPQRRIEVTMAPLKLPGSGSDVTDPDRNDACFYLLLSFDGPRHWFEGQRISDTIAYVWADGAWKVAGEVGRERKYGSFMRYIALGRGADKLGELRTLTRDVEADFRLAFPERAGAPVPDVTEVGLMIDSNTVRTESESLLRSIRFLP